MLADPSKTVVVIGAGPTGCTLALLLARLGISVAVVERNAAPQQHPAACILNTRTMEIFREVEVETEVRTCSQNVFERANIAWVVSLAGRELGRCSVLPENLQELLAVSPTHAVQFPQHRLEPILWERMEHQSLIAFYRNQDCTKISQDDKNVSAELIDTTTGQKRTLRGAYLVACDGASSVVRRKLGLAMKGDALQYMIGSHFFADLGRWVDHRKSVLYWVLNRDFVGVLIAHWLPSEWVLFTPYFPPQQTPEDFTSATCVQLIQQAVGVQDIADLRIQSSKAWVLSAKLAEDFQRQRIFLAGDAAHCFPPTGGLGLNTGVQDAHNLAWKLAAVLHGSAHGSLLDTYGTERRPVARENLEQSVHNFEKMNELTLLVGLDSRRLRWLERVQRSWLFRWLPLSWQRGMVAAAVKFARRNLAAFDRDGAPGDALRARFQALLPGQLPHYRYLGLDLGFAYRQGALVPDGSPKTESADPVMDYLPTTWPGARLPHVWVVRGQTRLSLHDLLNPLGFLLLTNPAGRQLWRAACQDVSRLFAMPLTCWSIGEGPDADLIDEPAAWERLSETGPTGAVMVRPDGHVAWRCFQAPDVPVAVLESVLCALGSRRTHGPDGCSSLLI
jgi:2-polyprenyl-6-methoxyphenol hydroxylase-like FAD-dependent oxidoreductase